MSLHLPIRRVRIYRFRLKTFLLLSTLSFSASCLAAGTKIPISGTVVDVDGAPVSGVRIDLYSWFDPTGSIPETEARTSPAVSTETDQRGGYDLLAPGSGMWRIEASAPGFPVRHYSLVPLADKTILPPVVLTPAKTLNIQVETDEGIPVDDAVVLTAGSTRRHPLASPWEIHPVQTPVDEKGRAKIVYDPTENVFLYAIAPGFLASDLFKLGVGETPPEEASLSLIAGRLQPILVQDAQGEPMGRVAVHLGLDGPAGYTDDNGTWTATVPKGDVPANVSCFFQSPDGRELRATLAASREPVVFTLPDLETLTGRIVDSDSSEPIAGALVWQNAELGAPAKTDVKGRYKVQVVPGPRIHLKSIRSGYFLGKGEVSPGDVAALFALRPTAIVSGRIVDPEGKAVFGATVDGAERRFVDANGHFRLDRLPPEQKLTLGIQAPGFALAEIPLLSPPGGDERNNMTVVLERGCHAVGRLRGSGGQAVADARIVLLRQDAKRYTYYKHEYTARTNAQGHFELPHLPSGKFNFKATAKGYGDLRIPFVEIEQATNHDFGDLQLQRGVEIRGQVVDANSRPLPQVEIFAKRSSLLPSYRPFTPPDAITDSAGHFTVRDRNPSEEFDLEVKVAGHVPTILRAVASPSDGLVIRLAHAGRIHGQVVDSMGQPVSGARIHTGPRHRTGSSNPAIKLTTLADSDGYFDRGDLAPGRLRLTVEADDYVSSSEEIELAAGASVERKVILQRGATLRGRVFDAAGVPRSGWSLDLLALYGQYRNTGSIHTTDSTGTYRVQALPVGHFKVTASSKSLSSQTFGRIEIQEGVNVLDLHAKAGFEVSGQVLTPEGQGVAGAEIRLVPDGQRDISSRRPRALSRADGTYIIRDVRPGSYTVNAQHPSWVSSSRPGNEVRRTAIRDVNLELRRGAVVRGQILGIENLKGSVVWILAALDGQKELVARERAHSGAFEIGPLPPGSWQIRAEISRSRRWVDQLLHIAPGQTEAKLDFEFAQGLTLSGQFLKLGQPMAKLRVKVMASRSTVSGTSYTVTDQEGRFRINGLEGESFQLKATPAGSRQPVYTTRLKLTADVDLGVIEISASQDP